MKELLPHIKLLPYRYKRYGLWVLVIGIPAVVLLTFGFIGIGLLSGNDAFFEEWSYPLIHYPIVVGLALLNFSEEKKEDEMVQHIRYQAFMTGVFYLIIALLLLPFFTNVYGLLRGKELSVPDVGGMFGATVMLLVYTYLFFKINLYRTRKALETDAE